MSTPAPDTKRITEPLRFDLTDHEVAAVARLLNVKTQERDRNTANFDRLKADHKSRDAGFELEINDCLRKINDGFEMRETQLEVSFNDPERGRKTTRRVDNGETIRVEAMTALDIEQRTLPLEANFLFSAVFLPNWEKVELRHFGSEAAQKLELIFSAPESGDGIKILKARYAERGTWNIPWRTKLEEMGYTEAQIKEVEDNRENVPVKIVETDDAPNGIDPHPHLTPDGERTGTLSHTEGGEGAGETTVGTVLDKAAAESTQPPVPLNLATFASDYKKAWKAFRKGAHKLGWSEAALAILDDQICKIFNREVVEQKDLSDSAFALLQAHVCAETK